MLRKTGLALGCVAMLCGMAPADPVPETVKRTGSWVVNYDADGCHLIGEFGTGPDRMLIRFTRYQPGDAFDLALFGKRFLSRFPRKPVTLNFGPDDAEVERETWNGKAGDLPVTFMSGVRLDEWQWRSRVKPSESLPDGVTLEQEAAVTGVTVHLWAEDPIRLEFGSLAKPFAQLRHCSDTLVRHWGYDPAALASLSRRLAPASPPQSWVSNRDFPTSDALGKNGQVEFRLDVDPEGKVTGCHILARTDPDEFSALTCKLMSARARFLPALDAQGKPVKSFFVSKFNWTSG